MPDVNGGQTQQNVSEIIKVAKIDLKNIQEFAVTQFANIAKKEQKPIDINSERFKEALHGVMEAQPDEKSTTTQGTNSVISVPATLSKIDEYIKKTEETGASKNDFKELRQEMASLKENLQAKFSTNDKVNDLIKNRVKKDLVVAAAPFMQVKNEVIDQVDKEEKVIFADKIAQNIVIPNHVYEELLKGNEEVKSKIQFEIIEPQITKSFATLTTHNNDKYLRNDESKLTKQSIDNFTEVTNQNLVDLDKSIAASKARKEVIEELRKHNPDISDKQAKQFESNLSILNTEYLKENKQQLASSLDLANKSTKLSFREKAYTFIGRKDPEIYLANKVGEIVIKEQQMAFAAKMAKSNQIKKDLNTAGKVGKGSFHPSPTPKVNQGHTNSQQR